MLYLRGGTQLGERQKGRTITWSRDVGLGSWMAQVGSDPLTAAQPCPVTGTVPAVASSKILTCPCPAFLRAPAPAWVWLPQGRARRVCQHHGPPEGTSAPLPVLGPAVRSQHWKAARSLENLYWPRGHRHRVQKAPETQTHKQGRPAAAAPGSGRQLIQVLLPPVTQVLLDDFRKEVPLQQGVGQGQQVAHRLVEVLQERRENKHQAVSWSGWIWAPIQVAGDRGLQLFITFDQALYTLLLDCRIGLSYTQF